MKITKIKLQIYLLYFFAFVGVLVSAYLWYEYSQPGEITCQIGGCQSVRESEYSSLWGISLPIYGFGYFVTVIIAAMSFLIDRKISKWEKIILVLMATFGFGFSVYLTFLELFVIKAICQWCVVSAVAATGIYFTVYSMFNPLKLLVRKVPNATD
jgi:uncharacterized membrane protein